MPAVMRVTMFSPSRMYGFAESDDARVFFHLEAFVTGPSVDGDIPPPPVVGEEVMVDYVTDSGSSDKAPRARVVERREPQTRIQGVVETFNTDRGWGFAKGDDGESYYLHRSDVEDGRLPIEGQTIQFFGGFKKGRPRACYVQVGRVGG